MSARRRTGAWERLFDGWQVGAVVLLLAASAVLLAVPRAVDPDEPPMPVLDERARGATRAADEALAERAAAHELDAEVRAVGREFRAYNLAARRALGGGGGDERKGAALEIELNQASYRLKAATRQALDLGADGLLALRAYQLRGFLRELAHWVESGEERAELVALGGTILAKLADSGWCRERGGGERELVAEPRVLAVLYKKMWNEAVGVRDGGFELTRDEERLRLGFFIRHPPDANGREPAGANDDVRLARVRAAARDRQALGFVTKLAEVDPDYPADLGRGVLLFRLEEYGAATDALRRFLERTPDGPYVLRAQNYLKACLDRTTQGLY